MFLLTTLNNIFDLLTRPFAWLEPVPGLALLSLLTALVLLNIFKRLSNQQKIKFHKDQIYGNFLEIALFRDQFSRTIFSQLRILKHNLLYMRYFMTPILIMMLPMLYICLQLDYRLGSQPIQPGDSFIVEASLTPAAMSEGLLSQLSIETSSSITLETDAMRSNQEGSVFWRARLREKADDNFVRVELLDNEVIEKNISTLRGGQRFSAEKKQLAKWTDIFSTAEDIIPPNSSFLSLRTEYEPAEYKFLAWMISPITYYFILTLGLGLLIKPFMKVNI